MYNTEILKRIFEEFGSVQAYLFCRMEAKKYQIICEQSSSMDDLYDLFWWTNAYKELDEKINNIQYENA